MIKSLINNPEELKKLYVEEGKSLKEIGDICGVAFQTVHKWMKKNNIPTRDFSTEGMKFPGRKLTQEQKDHLSKMHTGKKLSPEHKKKVIRNLKNKKGKKHASWSGGIYKTKKGYIMEYDPIREKHIRQHRLRMEEKIGRMLLKTEHIHHINGKRDDNRIENLQIVSNYEHALIHWTDPDMIKEQSNRIKKIRSEKYWSTKKKHLEE